MIVDIISLERPLVALDLETTGLSSKHDRIVQIGIEKFYPDGRITSWESIIDPTIPIPKEASDVHHITDEIVAGEPTFEDIAPILFVGLKECDLLGYNLHSFDVKFLVAEFARCKMKFIVPRIIDAYKIYIRHYPRNLTNAVAHYLNEDLVDAHSALADARASMRLFRAQLIRHPDIPRSVQDIHDSFFAKDKNFLDPEGKIIWNETGDAVMNFSTQHKGKLLKLVPRGFLQWVVKDAGFSDEIKFIVNEALQGRYPVKGAI